MINNIGYEKNPICFAVGDIEGDIDKLRSIDSTYIQKYQETGFVFIGDLINDLSDGNAKKESNLSCIQFITQNYLNDEEEDITNIDTLLNAIQQIQWRIKKYEEINNRVKFVAGNSEYDCLCDLQQTPRREGVNYIFGTGRWKKTFTFQQIFLIYRYLKNCHSIITMDNNYTSNAFGFKKTIYFRHALRRLDEKNVSPEILEKKLNVKRKDFNKRNFILIAGHSKVFAYEEPFEFEDHEMFFTIDTSSSKREKTFRHKTGYSNKIQEKQENEILGKGTRDLRIAMISNNEKSGYSVEAFPEIYNFRKSNYKIGFNDI